MLQNKFDINKKSPEKIEAVQGLKVAGTYPASAAVEVWRALNYQSTVQVYDVFLDNARKSKEKFKFYHKLF